MSAWLDSRWKVGASMSEKIYEFRVTVHHYVSFDADELNEGETPEDFARTHFDKGYEIDRDVETKVEPV